MYAEVKIGIFNEFQYRIAKFSNYQLTTNLFDVNSAFHHYAEMFQLQK